MEPSGLNPGCQEYVDSRVTLDTERDHLDMRKVMIDWRFGDMERKTLQRMNTIIALAVGGSGKSRMMGTVGGLRAYVAQYLARGDLQVPRAEATSIGRQIRDDFGHGRITQVDGWYLAETEARMCALFCLQFPETGLAITHS